jgi:chemotaxis protein histidine kinase CheA
MEKKVIDLQVNDNLEPTIANLKRLKQQLKETAAGSKEFDRLSAEIRDLDDAIADAKKSNDDFLGQLENASGPLGMLGKSIRGAETTFSSFNGALKASVIGLIVGLIGGLVAAFRDNEAATKKLQPLLDGMQKIFQGIFRAVEPLFNTLVDLAISALPMVSEAFSVVYGSVTAVFQSLGALGSAIKKLVSGDFSGAWKDAKSSVTDFSKNYDDSIKRFNEGTKELTKTEKEEAEKREEARKKALEKKEAAEEKAKQAAIKKAEEEAAALKAIADKKLADDMKSAQDALNIITALNQSYETPAEKETREYNEKKAILEANNLSTELLTQKHLENLALIVKTDADKKAAEDAKIAADKKTKDDAAAKEELDREQAVANGKKAIQDSYLNVASNGISLLKTVFEKNKAIQKGLIVAESAVGLARIVTSTQAANAADMFYASTMGPAGAAYLAAKIPLNYVGAAIGAAANIAATAKALSSLGGGSAGSAPSGGGATGGGPAPAQFNVVGNSGVNQLADVMNTQQQTPVKTYVVAQDVTSGQSLDRNIIRNASLG